MIDKQVEINKTDSIDLFFSEGRANVSYLFGKEHSSNDEIVVQLPNLRLLHL